MSFIDYFKGKQLFHKRYDPSLNIINVTGTFSSSVLKCRHILERHADLKSDQI